MLGNIINYKRAMDYIEPVVAVLFKELKKRLSERLSFNKEEHLLV